LGVTSFAFLLIHDGISPMDFVIPGLTKPAPYLIRGNPGFPVKTGSHFICIVPRFRGDDVWIPAFARMTSFAPIDVAVYRKYFEAVPCITAFPPMSGSEQQLLEGEDRG